jgi:hypothetical protein
LIVTMVLVSLSLGCSAPPVVPAEAERPQAACSPPHPGLRAWVVDQDPKAITLDGEGRGAVALVLADGQTPLPEGFQAHMRQGRHAFGFIRREQACALLSAPGVRSVQAAVLKQPPAESK